ncbi:MAG: hypothetical protein ACRDHZ_02910 [Ktedonobacteraceae bacterium]
MPQHEPSLKISKLQANTAAGTSTITTSSFDMQGFRGYTILSSFETPDATNIAKLQDSLVSGSGFNDIAGSHIGDGTHGDLVLDHYQPLLRYHRAVFTRGVSTAIGEVWLMQYGAFTEPQTNATSSQALVELVSAADGTA